jgi:hypothetical protein
LAIAGCGFGDWGLPIVIADCGFDDCGFGDCGLPIVIVDCGIAAV